VSSATSDSLAAAPRAVRWLDAGLVWLARHWLALFLLAAGLFIALPIAAPLLAAGGHDRLSGLIYFLYRLTCHQLPQRSWFLGGQAAAYDWATVQPYTDLPLDGALQAFHHPLGNDVLGFQIAFCQRDTAIYLSLFLAGLAYAALRRRRPLRPLPWWAFALALVPIALDGVTQLVGLRESTPLLRTLTGAILGTATAFLALPYLDAGMREMLPSPGGDGDREPPPVW
jgi:uncharacterized membrane protein